MRVKQKQMLKRRTTIPPIQRIKKKICFSVHTGWLRKYDVIQDNFSLADCSVTKL